jgi:hypothetical protein
LYRFVRVTNLRKVFNPNFRRGWGQGWTFGTGSSKEPVLKASLYDSCPAYPILLIFSSLPHISKIIAPLTLQTIFITFSTILTRLMTSIYPRVSNIILTSGVPNLAHFFGSFNSYYFSRASKVFDEMS